MIAVSYFLPFTVLRPTALAAFLFLSFCVVAAFAAAPAPLQTDAKFQRSFPATPGSVLTVENLRGSIHVTGGDKDEVVVNVTKNFRGKEKDKLWWMSAVKVDIENGNGLVKITVVYPDSNCDDTCGITGHARYTASIDLSIAVPRRTTLHLSGRKPDIAVSSIEGDITVNSHKSPITIQATTGSIEINTTKDDVKVTNVAITNSLVIKSEKSTVLVEATSLGKDARLETDKGSIVIKMPSNAGAEVDFSGGRRSSFHSAFPIASNAAGNAAHEIHGTINQGGTQLHLRANKGSISLEKK